MNNETDISLKFTNKINGEAKLERYERRLQSIKNILETFPKDVNLSAIEPKAKDYSKTLEQIYKQLTNSIKVTDSFKKKTISSLSSIKDVANATRNAGNEAKETGNLFDKAFSIGRFSTYLYGLKKVTSTFTNLIDKSSDYLENINLYQVAFNGAYQEADKFVNTITEMYGLDESWATKTVGIFRQLANAMGLATDTGETLSKLMTQMSIDVSSLYNVDIGRASTVLQSALAGQTRPIRSVAGADITMNTLQGTLNELGIDRAISDLSFAEKRLIIVVSLVKQLNQSIGDFGRTIESPANQLRVMNEQWERLSRAVGNVFLPIVSKVLPYLNAILMVLTEIINSIATLLGFRLDDYDYFGEIDDSVIDLEEGLNGANESAKKLKQSLRGFDKLNNITTPSATSTSVGAGGISGDILGAFDDAYAEYMSKLEKIEMKATKIRNRIMEWLGFTKELNPITGDIEWKYQGFTTTLKNIWTWFKKLTPQGKLVAGLIAGFVTVKTIKTITSLVKLLGRGLGLSGVLSIAIPLMKNMGEFTNAFAKSSGSLTTGLQAGLNMWSKQLTVMERLNLLLVGAGGLILSLGLLKSGLSDVAEQGEFTATSLLKVAGGIAGTTASGALIGSQFGAIGTLIGGVTGLLIGFYQTYMNYPDEITRTSDAINKALDSIEEYNKDLLGQYDTIHDTMEANLSLQGSYSSLVDELENITDANGKVKQGYEERAEFIVTTLNKAYGFEMEIIDGVIQNYQDEVKSIKEVIAEKRKQIALESIEEAYALAMKHRVLDYKNYIEAQDEYTRAIQNSEEAQKKLKEAQENYDASVLLGANYRAKYGIELKKARKEYEQTQEDLERVKGAYEQTEKTWEASSRAIMTYNGLVSADLNDNAELVEKYITDIENSYFDGKDTIILTLEEQRDKSALTYAEILATAKKNSDEIDERIWALAESEMNATNTSLTEMTKSVNGYLGDGLKKAWQTLADVSEDKFLEEFGKLPQDIQQDVVDKMQDKGYKISEELQKGINLQNPTIKFSADTSQAEATINNWTNGTKTSLWSKLRNIFLGGISFHADGGMPPVGQLFVANENGAELVGNIGGQTFVANQHQMLDIIKGELATAKGSTTNATFIVQVGDEQLGTYVIKDLEGKAKANGKPFTIGG